MSLKVVFWLAVCAFMAWKGEAKLSHLHLQQRLHMGVGTATAPPSVPTKLTWKEKLALAEAKELETTKKQMTEALKTTPDTTPYESYGFYLNYFVRSPKCPAEFDASLDIVPACYKLKAIAEAFSSFGDIRASANEILTATDGVVASSFVNMMHALFDLPVPDINDNIGKRRAPPSLTGEQQTHISKNYDLAIEMLASNSILSEFVNLLVNPVIIDLYVADSASFSGYMRSNGLTSPYEKGDGSSAQLNARLFFDALKARGADNKKDRTLFAGKKSYVGGSDLETLKKNTTDYYAPDKQFYTAQFQSLSFDELIAKGYLHMNSINSVNVFITYECKTQCMDISDISVKQAELIVLPGTVWKVKSALFNDKVDVQFKPQGYVDNKPYTLDSGVATKKDVTNLLYVTVEELVPQPSIMSRDDFTFTGTEGFLK